MLMLDNNIFLSGFKYFKKLTKFHITFVFRAKNVEFTTPEL